MWFPEKSRPGSSLSEATMKVLPFGVAVIEGDTHVSKWIEESGTLAIAERNLRPFRKYVPKGSCVLDIGAMIGDHTVTYADWVGPEGHVIAFEPHPESLDCLRYNMRLMQNVTVLGHGLSEFEGTMTMNTSPNFGASFLSDSGGELPVEVKPLDELDFSQLGRRISFIKIDAEGSEPWILRGGKNLLLSHKPAMLIEVNQGALERAGSSREELFSELRNLGYIWRITDRNLKVDDPQYDIICVKPGN